ncbi:expressed unknown protein [Seminavis robusta]|uniref:Uncharacterized protein n=1 Tax=Seminavis robusta TaxID=568900 RepID=A0A9N8DA16_9STRA|nr:expressed unknown protein [Seminavis robusta]|eukprot:Sro52_g031040.1 n/a (256) ;mRNA; f:84896-85663
MCLTTTATTEKDSNKTTTISMNAKPPMSPRTILKRTSAPALLQGGGTIKKSVSDTNLFAMADFDENEAVDAFYVPGGDGSDDDSSTEDDTFGMTVDVDEVDVDDFDDDDCTFDEPPEIPTPTGFHKKTVSFGNLEELSFPVVQGDPNFEMAYPMTLGWDAMDGSISTIDDYEKRRKGCRRLSHEMSTSSEDRRKIIKNSKKLEKEIAKQRAKDGKRNNNGRPGLVRRNSMSNGMMFGRDKRRNRVQTFLTRMTGR